MIPFPASANGKKVRHNGFLALVWQVILKEKVNSGFKTVVMCFKSDLVSHPVRGERIE